MRSDFKVGQKIRFTELGRDFLRREKLALEANAAITGIGYSGVWVEDGEGTGAYFLEYEVEPDLTNVWDDCLELA